MIQAKERRYSVTVVHNRKKYTGVHVVWGIRILRHRVEFRGCKKTESRSYAPDRIVEMDAMAQRLLRECLRDLGIEVP